MRLLTALALIASVAALLLSFGVLALFAFQENPFTIAANVSYDEDNGVAIGDNVQSAISWLRAAVTGNGNALIPAENVTFNESGGLAIGSNVQSAINWLRASFAGGHAVALNATSLQVGNYTFPTSGNVNDVLKLTTTGELSFAPLFSAYGTVTLVAPQTNLFFDYVSGDPVPLQTNTSITWDLDDVTNVTNPSTFELAQTTGKNQLVNLNVALSVYATTTDLNTDCVFYVLTSTGTVRSTVAVCNLIPSVSSVSFSVTLPWTSTETLGIYMATAAAGSARLYVRTATVTVTTFQ